jgi:hypothetical protein
MELQSLIRDYKQALSEYELASKKKEYIKEQFLKVIEWQPGTYGDILVSKSKQPPIVEWKELISHLCIEQEVISRYTVYRPEILKVTVKRSII